jgi:hypothetical protein
LDFVLRRATAQTEADGARADLWRKTIACKTGDSSILPE